MVAVRIDGLAPGGDAVGRQRGGEHAGRATFVPLAAPGEEVRVLLTREKARVAWGELAEVVTASPARVAPRCPLFGGCGGCQWQHVDLGAQRAAKRAIVARALALPDVPLREPSPSGWGYRERARLAVGPGGAVGFRARRSHDVVDVSACPLLSPALERALGAVRAAAGDLPPGTQIDLLAGAAGVHVAISAAADGARLLASAGTHGIVGVRAANGTWGAPDVDVAEPDGAPLRIPAGGFAQVGSAANAALVRAVDEALAAAGAFGPAPAGEPEPAPAPRTATILELHAGSGNFTRRLAALAAAVGATLVACDADAAAVERGRRQVPGASWLGAPPADLVPDVVIVDPPRDGLDPEALAVARRARRALVYVSCDPQTLGRDTARLRADGFTVAYAVALDLMPHTFHVEVVAGFARRR